MSSATLSVFPGQLTTPFSQMTDILSSTPLTPLGILVKSSLPRAFWHTEKVQLSVPVTVRSSLERFHGKIDVIDEAGAGNNERRCKISPDNYKIINGSHHRGLIKMQSS